MYLFSIYRKKRGQKPTGILVHTAKKTGFSSVSELLKTSGSDKYFYTKKVKPVCAHDPCIVYFNIESYFVSILIYMVVSAGRWCCSFTSET